MRTEHGLYRDLDVTATAAPSSPSSWFSTSLTNICAPLLSCVNWKPRRSKSTSLTSISWPLGRESDQDLLIGEDDEKQRHPISEQPQPMPHPVLQDNAPADHRPSAGEDEKQQPPPRKSFASSRTILSLKKRFRSDGSTYRPKISAPTDFRHLESTSFRFPGLEPEQQRHQQQPPAPRPRYRDPATAADRSMFRPLELSIYMSDNRVSPILPLFEFPSVTPPQPAHLMDRLDDHHEIVRQRSSSSMPFHIPRRRAAGGSVSSSAQDGNEDREAAAPSIPPKSSARARAHTSPEVEQMKARVAGAMIEVEKLQRQIDDVIERQSLYASSRPSTAHSMARTMPELEPMPDIPALPPSAPSFAERLYDFERPQGSPVKSPFEISNRSQDFGEQQQQQQQQQHTAAGTLTRVRREDPPLAPPLPLVLRPPLRKKKSFSRVSTWLFPNSNGAHSRDISLDSVTNQPRPIKRTEGFFQCVPGAGADRMSFDSLGSISTHETDDDDDDDEERTGPTTWSPGSTPAMRQDELPALQRVATFGTGSSSSRPFRCSAIVVS